MAPKKKKVRNLTKFVHGDEPLVKNANKMQTIELLNWYAAVSQPDDRVSWAEAYLSARGMNKYIDAVKKNERSLIPTALHLMRALDHGSTFESIDNVNGVIQAELQKALTLNEEKNTEVKSAALAKKSREASQFWEVQDLVDGILSGKNLIPAKPEEAVTGEARKHFESQLNELSSIHSDPDLEEGYSSIPEARIQSAIEFLNETLNNKKVERKKAVRRKREVPPMKKVARLTYMREWEGIYSIPPTKILGAKTLIVFNTKNRRLAVFKSKDGFDVRGNKILGWDTCSSRVVRKPKETLESIVPATPFSAEQIFNSLKTSIWNGYSPMRPTVLILKAK